MTISFKQLEAKFQRNLNEYKSTYQDYMVELNNSRGTYWNTEENVTVSNKGKGAMIPFLTQPDITKSKCLHECSSDPRCQYVLFSDSGNGECAANQCLKWTKEAGGIIKANSKPQFFNIFVGNSNSNKKTITLPDTGITVYSTPINAQDPSWGNTFSVTVSGSQLSVKRTDQNTGWGQQLQLQGVKDASGFKEYTINVGSSSSNPAVITLPTTGLTVSPTPINPQNPDWNNTFNVSVSGDQLTVTRTDMNSGWGQKLQLRAVEGNNAGFMMENKGCASGQGPSSTNYVYSGWEKPSWKDSNNISFMGNPTDANPAEWKDIGSASNLVACKDMSIRSEKGPFSSVVFVNQQNKCYGGVPNAKQSSIKMEGVYSSVPPMGSTSMGGSSAMVYMNKLKTLNNALKNDLMKMRELLSKQRSGNNDTSKLIEKTQNNIHSDYDKLNKDRVKLDEMQSELNSLDVKLGLLSTTTTREKMMYMGSAAALLVIIFAFIYRKSS